MKVLFAVADNENGKSDIVEVIVNEYQQQYKKIISYKRAFYFDAILNEVKQTRNDNRYDLIIVSEDLENNSKESYENQDLILYKNMDLLTDEAYKEDGTMIPIILICNDRRSDRDPMISKLFALGMYNVLYGKDRTIQNVCSLIDKPRNKKEAKIKYNINSVSVKYESEASIEKIISNKELISILRFFNTNKDNVDKCVRGFAKLYKEMNTTQLNKIIANLPIDIKLILEDNSKEYVKICKVSVKKQFEEDNKNSFISKNLGSREGITGQSVIIPNQSGRRGLLKRKKTSE